MTKLHPHLIAKTAPVALPENILLFKDYRITVLGDRLFRVEKDPTGAFNDAATQTVWFRNLPAVSFTAKKKKDAMVIATDKAVLTVTPVWEDCTVAIDGVSHPLCNDGENLLGTARTLDCYNGEINIRDGKRIVLEKGVCSKSGVAVVEDAGILCLKEDGELAPAPANEHDLYVFAFGHDYRGAVKALYDITGYTPMLPRYAMGNWWSRYHRYTDEEYLWLMDKFAERNIPLTVATVDMDWHYANFVDQEKKISEQGKATADRGCLIEKPGSRKLGWTGYSWNKGLFPDYKSFLKALGERQLRVTLNLHPRDGVRFFEDMYPEMAKAMGIDPATERVVEFDITDPDFVNNYFDILHRPYEKDGVDFWWIDWQQGTKSKMEGLDPLWALNHYHFLDNEAGHVRPLIMSRYAGVGSHRYPIGFSGDTTIDWASLEYVPYFTANATNIGYTWWSHDIGGHMMGKKDDELYLRYLQFGVFNPLNRLHSSDSPVYTKEPWAFGGGVGELAAEWMRFRHRMIPYLYTCNYDTHKNGIGLCEPVYYRHPENEKAYDCKSEYYFGPSLLVAPVTKKSEAKGLTSTKVFLPEGFFTDIFTGDTYEVPAGGGVYTMVRPLDSIPVLAKAGSVLPLGLDEGNSPDNPRKLEAKIFNGNGEYTLFEDKDRAEGFTHFKLEGENGFQKVTVTASGDLSVIPADRTLVLTFPNIEVHNQAYVNDPVVWPRRDLCRVRVKKNGTPTEAKIESFGIVRVTLQNYDPTATYTVEVDFEKTDATERFKRGFYNKILLVESSIGTKSRAIKEIQRICEVNPDGTPETYAAGILISGLDEIDKKRLTENVFFA